jgi:hypothetical protein
MNLTLENRHDYVGSASELSFKKENKMIYFDTKDFRYLRKKRTPGIITRSTSLKISSHFSPLFGASLGISFLKYPGCTSGNTRRSRIVLR